jgi:hypothetical protein
MKTPEATELVMREDCRWLSNGEQVNRVARCWETAKFGGFIAEETEKWAKVIRAVNIRAE